MRELPTADELPLTMAALRLRDSYHMVRTRMLRGELRGRQVGGRWYVQKEDVERLEAERAEPVAQLA